MRDEEAHAGTNLLEESAKGQLADLFEQRILAAEIRAHPAAWYNEDENLLACLISVTKAKTRALGWALRAQGMSMIQLMGSGAAGTTLGAHSRAVMLRELGCTATELYREAGYAAEELRAAGYSCHELMTIGLRPFHFRRLGAPLSEIVNEFSPHEFHGSGYPAADFRRENRNPAWLLMAGFTKAELVAAGYAATLLASLHDPIPRPAPRYPTLRLHATDHA